MGFWDGAGAAIIGGGGSGLFQGFYNDMNRTNADHAMDRGDNAAREQMNFQRQMSNTAHQREVEDLKAAGLNPVLSAGGGPGASTPSGASNAGQQAQLTNPFQSMFSNAIDAMKARGQLDQLKSGNELLKAQTAAATADANKKIKESEILGPQSFLYNKVEQMFRSGAKNVDAAKSYLPQEKVENSGPTPRQQEIINNWRNK